MIYADNAATTRLDEDAFEAMKPFLMGSYGNPSQPYTFARKPRKAIRISFGRYNDPSDAETIAESIIKIIKSKGCVKYFYELSI